MFVNGHFASKAVVFWRLLLLIRVRIKSRPEYEEES
jgi:hypothetical protein